MPLETAEVSAIFKELLTRKVSDLTYQFQIEIKYPKKPYFGFASATEH